MTTWKRERVKHVVSYVVLFILIIAFIASIVFLFNTQPVYTSKCGIYKGYLKRGARYIYPIVEIDGQEVISTHSQAVRDDSYIGSTVYIKYIGDDMRRFIVQW